MTNVTLRQGYSDCLTGTQIVKPERLHFNYVSLALRAAYTYGLLLNRSPIIALASATGGKKKKNLAPLARAKEGPKAPTQARSTEEEAEGL